MDVHTCHTYVSDVLSFLFFSYKSRVGSGWRKICLKKTEHRWKIRRDYVTRRTPTNIEKCNNRLGVDTNTEPVFIIPDRVVHDVKNQATKVRETIRFVEYSPDAAAWPWPTHPTALLHHGGDDAATLRHCPDAVTLLLLVCFMKFQGWFSLIWKNIYLNKK